MTFFRRLRLRYGLTWRKHYPTPADAREFIRAVLAMLVILVVYGVVGRLDYEEELRQEAERARLAEQRVLDCLNGKPLGYTTREKRSAFDYGRTVILCKTEELDV